MSGSSDPWSTFRTGGGLTDGPPPPAGDDPWAAFRASKPAPDPAREKARAENSTVGGMLSGTQRAIENSYTFGLRDEAQAALEAGLTSAFTGVRDFVRGGRKLSEQITGENTASSVYDDALARERKQSAQFGEDHPVLSTAGNLVGGALIPGQMGAGYIRGTGLMASVGRGAVAAGVGGAATGFGDGEGGFQPRAANALLGGALGAGAGGVLAGGANVLLGAGRRLANASGLRDPDAMAERLMLRAAERDAPQGRPVAAEIDRMGAQLDPNAGMAGPGLPARPNEMILPDVAGENMTNLAAVAANTPGRAKTLAGSAVEARRGASPERIAGAVDDGFGGGGGTRVADEVGALREQRSNDARPLYDAAFGRDVPEAVTQRLDPVLASREGQTALGHAVTILERESRAKFLRSGDEADLFDPASMGLVRAEDGGWMLEGGMKNMRLADAVKRGMDDMLEKYRNPMTKQLELDEAGRALNDQRAAYVGFLRDQPELQPYAQALDAWAGPSRSLDAVAQGRKALTLDRDVVASIAQRLPPADLEFFRLGVGRAVTDATADPRNAPGFARKLLENRQMQARLQQAIPDPAQRAQFAAAMEQEVHMAATSNAVNPRAGSQTGRLTTGGADMEIDPPSGLVQGMLDATERGGITGAAARGVRNLYSRAQGINPATSTALANRLFSMDPAQQAATIAQLRNRLLLDEAGAARGRAIARPIFNGIGVAAGLQTN